MEVGRHPPSTYAYRSTVAGCRGERFHARGTVFCGSDGRLARVSPWIANDERSIAAPGSAVKRPSDRYEIVLTAQDQRSALCRRHPDGTERVVDDLGALAAPPQQSRQEAAERDRPLALREEGNAADPDLEPRFEQNLGAARAIDPDTILATFVTEQPRALRPDQATMKAGHAACAIVELECTSVCRPYRTLISRRPGQWMDDLCPPLSQAANSIIHRPIAGGWIRPGGHMSQPGHLDLGLHLEYRFSSIRSTRSANPHAIHQHVDPDESSLVAQECPTLLAGNSIVIESGQTLSRRPDRLQQHRVGRMQGRRRRRLQLSSQYRSLRAW